MPRFLLPLLAPALFASTAAAADSVQLPLRKPGLWDIQMRHEGNKLPNMSISQCTSEAVDREFTSEFAPAAKQSCEKTDIQKTATGYVSDSVCSAAGATVKTHAETTGDFNSAYTVKVTTHSEGGRLGTRDTAMTLTAKWIGECKPGQKPGDVIMPGGFKMNLHDMQKMKALLPK
ncbi:MAG TPA: DUF3617 family protein [Nitrobacter sp.]|nr:DUF3617 family protein [Nitrobacter sp.]